MELLSAQRVNGVVGATFAVTTAGPTSISVPMCGRRVAASLERDSADVWVMVGGTVCPATLPMAPQVLVPGVPAGGTLAIGTLSSGRYRIGVDYSVYASRPVGPAVSGHAVSSAFDVR